MKNPARPGLFRRTLRRSPESEQGLTDKTSQTQDTVALESGPDLKGQPDGVDTVVLVDPEPPFEESPADRADLVAATVGQWRTQLVQLGGESALSNLNLLGEARLDISHAHPSGVAQLFAGRPTRLSNLIRDPGRLSTARRRARNVTIATSQMGQRFGVAPAYLAIGVTRWNEPADQELESYDLQRQGSKTALGNDDITDVLVASIEDPAEEDLTRDVQAHLDPEDVYDDDATRSVSTKRYEDETRKVSADQPTKKLAAKSQGVAAQVSKPSGTLTRIPVLLRPIKIEAVTSNSHDYELTLEDRVELNPILVRRLRAKGIRLDATALSAEAFAGGSFDPVPVLDHLRALGEAVFDNFRVDDSLLIGAFIHPGQALVDDLDAVSGILDRHEVVAALAGSSSAIDQLWSQLPQSQKKT